MSVTSRSLSIVLFAAVVASAGCVKKEAAPPVADPTAEPAAEAKAPSKPDLKPGEKPSVVFETSMGSFTMRMEPAKAPESVKNFLQYVYFTLFQRILPLYFWRSSRNRCMALAAMSC